MKVLWGIVVSIVTVASIIALWSSFGIIAGVILCLLVMGCVVFGGLEVYERYRAINYRYDTENYVGAGVYGAAIEEEPDTQLLIGTPQPETSKNKASSVSSQATRRPDAPIPSLATRLASGGLTPKEPFVFAWKRDDERVEAIQSDVIRTTGIMGLQNGGKTVTTLAWMASAVAKSGGNIRFIVTDPHMFAQTGEELATKIAAFTPYMLTVEEVRTTVQPDDRDYSVVLRKQLANPNDGGADLKGWCRIVRREIDRRLHGKKGPTWVLVIDEFSSVMREDEVSHVVQTLQDITQQSRKVDIHALVIGQDFRAAAMGNDTAIRNTIPVWIVHRSNQAWASAILPSDKAKVAPTLDVGEALVYGLTGQTERGMVSYTTLEDTVEVAQRYAPTPGTVIRIEEIDNETQEPANQHSDIHTRPTEQLGVVLSTQQQEPALVSGEEEHPFDVDEWELVMEAVRQGLDQTDIAKHVWGVKSGPELTLKRKLVGEMLAWRVSH